MRTGLLVACMLLPLTAVRAQNVPDTSHLRHGINTSGWFAQVYDPKGYSKEHFQSYVTTQDIALIKSMGFDHVRLSINPQPLFQGGHADQLAPEYLGYLDAAVKMIVDHGLAVILDVHPESDFKAKLADDEFVEQFADFWRALARHYSNGDAGMMFFEVLNEPELRDRFRWAGIQSKLARAIREGAPKHTIIAAGARWSSDEDLLFLEPLPDANIIYSFHFYEPTVFTHQGATWSVNYWHNVQHLSYPSNRESAEKAAANVPDEINRLYVLRYGMEHWDAARIDMEIGQVAEWAKSRKVPVMCDEFGVYREDTDPADRGAWLLDVRTSLEKHDMGWTLWDYDGGFGVVTTRDGRRATDESSLRALGLVPSGNR